MEEEQSKDEPVAKASPSDTFCNTMSSMICQKDVEIIHSIQMNAFSKMDKTNEKFDKFNRLSSDRYNRLHNHFQNHTRMLVDMKKDLDIVFRRIRNLKTKLSKQYGDAFMVTSKNIQKIEELEVQATYTEEKPQSEPQQTDTTDTQNRLKTHGQDRQDSLNAQSSSLGAEETATNTTAEEIETRKSKDGRVSTQSKTAYESKLVPQLSTSDESYGVQDTDSDDDNGGDVGDDNNDDNGGDDGKDNDGDNSNINTLDGDDDNRNEDVNDDDKDANSAKQHQGNSPTSNFKQQSSHETASKTTCNKELNKSNEESPTQDAVVATHCEYSSSDESLESDSDDETGDTQNKDIESRRTYNEGIQSKNINS